MAKHEGISESRSGLHSRDFSVSVTRCAHSGSVLHPWCASQCGAHGPPTGGKIFWRRISQASRRQSFIDAERRHEKALQQVRIPQDPQQPGIPVVVSRSAHAFRALET